MKQLCTLLFISLLIACSSNIAGTSSDVEVELAMVVGVVSSSDKTPVDGAAVSLFYEYDTVAVNSTISSPSGEYRFDSLDVGSYRVLATFNDSLKATTNLEVLDTFNDDRISLDTLFLTPPGTISGSITSYDGAGLVFVYIPGTSFIATVDYSGYFEMSGVTADSNYTVVFERYGFSPVSISNVSVVSGETTHLAPQSLTPNMYPQNVTASYDSVANVVTLIWSEMDRTDIEGYVVSCKESDNSALLPTVIHSELVAEVMYRDTLHDSLFSRSDTLNLQYQVQGQTTGFGDRTGYSLPAFQTVYIQRDINDYQSITVTNPKKGDTLIGLSSFEVEWNYTGLIDSVELYYTLDGGTRWNPLGGVIKNQGSYVWGQVENGHSDRCQIKVVNRLDNSVVGVSAQFTIIHTPVENMLNNGDFSGGMDHWTENIFGNAKGEFNSDSGFLYINLTQIDTVAWYASFFQTINSAMNDTFIYSLEFKAKASKPHELFLSIQTDDFPSTIYATERAYLKEEWQTFFIDDIKLYNNPNGVRAPFNVMFGYQEGELWFDDFKLTVTGIN